MEHVHTESRSCCGVGVRRYTDQNFDTEFFSVLQRAVRICIAEAGSATLDDVVSYLRGKARTQPCTHAFLRLQTNSGVNPFIALVLFVERSSSGALFLSRVITALGCRAPAFRLQQGRTLPAEIQTHPLWLSYKAKAPAGQRAAGHRGRPPDLLLAPRSKSPTWSCATTTC